MKRLKNRMYYGGQDYTKLEDEIGYKFKDESLLDIAFTHKSYSNEYHLKKVPSYERFEFLGDAILEFVTSETLFNKFPEKPEGQLTKLRASLVCEMTLSQISRNLHLGDYLYLSKGEMLTGGNNRASILCDLFEALLGAIYLDGGIEEAKKFVMRFLLDDIEAKAMYHDAKSILQEYSQKNSLELHYELISETGPDHNKSFTVAAVLNGKKCEVGTGHTMKAAEQEAAHKTILMNGISI